MGKRVAVLAVNPVNGYGLFAYLESFFENGISYRTFAVSDKKEIVTNSGIPLFADDVVANLVGHEGEFDALVFACGDAIPKFAENASAQYNVDMMAVVRAFAKSGKIMAGHCASALIFEFAGVLNGHKVAVHPLAGPAVKNGVPTGDNICVDRNVFTAQTEATVGELLPGLIEALRK